MEARSRAVVVLGAGVSGLTTALLLSRKPEYKITIVAKHMPGDYDMYYASPWAGANYAPVSISNTPEAEWDRHTWTELAMLAKQRPEAGVHFQENVIYVRNKDRDTAIGDWLKEVMKPEGPWFKDFVPNFHVLDESACPTGYDAGLQCTSVCINTALYLPWLASECLKAGVTIKRASLAHIDEAFGHSADGQPAHLVVNCCGLGASTLGGVHDPHMVPIRGQTVLVRNEAGGSMVECSGTDDTGDDEVVYVMQRAAGGGTILGGSYQKHNTDPKIDEALSIRIMRRAVTACPALTGGRGIEALDVVQARVGLRPARTGGTRVELERRDEKRAVVHNYGHGGFGYQCSWGCSTAVVELVERAFQEQ